VAARDVARLYVARLFRTAAFSRITRAHSRCSVPSAGARADLGGVTIVTSQPPPPLAQQPISCYYYACHTHSNNTKLRESV